MNVALSPKGHISSQNQEKLECVKQNDLYICQVPVKPIPQKIDTTHPSPSDFNPIFPLVGFLLVLIMVVQFANENSNLPKKRTS